MLRLGLLGGACTLLVRQGYSKTSTVGGRQLTPFLDRLPLPPSPREIEPHRAGTLPAELANLSPDCRRFVDRLGTQGRVHCYKIVAEVRRVQFHTELPLTEVWGYRDGTLPAGTPWNFALGPTFIRHVGDSTADNTIVRHVSELPSVADHRGFGEPRSTVHLHGGHHPSFADGFPADIILPNGQPFKPVFQRGEHFDYFYPMTDPGFFDNPLSGDVTERPSTLWYHDHLLDFTGQNVYRGLTGFYLVFENPKGKSARLRETARDTGDETNADNLPHALRLPSGPFDVPLALQDKSFGPNGELVFDAFNFDGFLGDQYLVNGKVQPFLPVKRRKYRLRFMNASNARFYQLFLTDKDGHSYPMTQIATEGGLLSRPIERESFMLGMAERVEVVVDFSRFPDSRFQELYIENRLVQDDGRGPGGKFGEPDLVSLGTKLLKFVLEEEVPDPSRVPGELRPFRAIPDEEIDRAPVREFVFNRSHGLWTINGEVGDLARPLATPTRDAGEVWRLINKSGGWWHPIHVHDEFARVLLRDGKAPFGGVGPDNGQSLELDGLAKKDTIILGPGSEVEIFVKFRDYVGPYVFHCHNLEHEDHVMMARFDVK
jgi:FtsP/CotA-like multicopper oxidase with cupredoxin domain